MKTKKGMTKEQILLLKILDEFRIELREIGVPKERAPKPARVAALVENDTEKWMIYFNGRIDLLAQDIRSGRRLTYAAFNIGMLRGIKMALADPEIIHYLSDEF